MTLCFALFLAAVIVCLLLGRSLLWALTLGLALFFLLGLRRGYPAKTLIAMAWQRGRESLVVVGILLLIGTLTGLWRSSGTIACFLYYGLQGVEPRWFVLMAFLLSALMSLALGTSFGVTSTAGVVLITMARSGGVDTAIVAGAVLSGAYFGDRCSPMSSCAALVANCTGTELYKNVREMLRTAALPTALTVGIFALLSGRNPIVSADETVLTALRDGFRFTPLLLLPAVLVLLLPLLKVPMKWAMAASAMTAFGLTVLWQRVSAWEALRIAVLGFQPQGETLRAILTGGGIVSMLTAIGIVLLTSLYAGILEGIHALDPAKSWSEHLAGKLGLFPATCITSAAVVSVFCNQSVMTIMDAQLLSDCYRSRGASRTELAMDIANSGVMLAGLIPWSIALTVPLAMLDVGLEAVPWCVLLYLIPLCYLFTRRFYLPRQREGERWCENHPEKEVF